MGNFKDKLHGLYAISDETLISEDTFSETIEAALLGGAKIIQYRDKSNNKNKRLEQANATQSLCRQHNAICIINDDIELAATISADGVHLGKHDSSIEKARQRLGKDIIIGISCYNDITLAIEAEANTADYVAFGAIYPSLTKPDSTNTGLSILTQAKAKLSVPVCAIGGITENNIQDIIQHGADMTAVISSLFSTEDIKKTATNLSKYFI